MSFFSGLFNRSCPLNLEGFVDWHCHILPGVDDGVRSMNESMEMLDVYEMAGIKEVWLTPHVMEDVPNTTAMLRARFQDLEKAYSGKVRLHLASENMMDNLLLERLETGDVLPIGNDGRTLLVETSYFNAPIKLNQTIETIKSKGYFPLLAHPERYDYIDSISSYRKLREQGVRFQLNLMSLCGYYGPAVKDKAQKLLSEGMYECIGSDCHRKEHIEIICDMKLSRSIMERLADLT